jgi:peptidyl-prolyl cis-trans isomerase SurA
MADILSEVPACRDKAEGPAVAFPMCGSAKPLILALLLIVFQTLAAQQPDSSAPVVLDRAVAVVNRQVILSSDLDDEIRLSILEPDRGGELTAQQALEQLISRTLIVQQIHEQDFQSVDPTPEQVEARVAELRKELPACVHENCASDAGWEKFLAANGLTPARVESYLRYRLEILSFIEQRFRQGIQITQQQIETYYHDTLLPQYRPGETVPPLDQVSSRIQEILLEQQVNVLFDNWLANLRQQGDVEVLDPALSPAIQSAATHSNAEPSNSDPSTVVPTPNAPEAVPPPTSAPSTPEPNHR